MDNVNRSMTLGIESTEASAEKHAARMAGRAGFARRRANRGLMPWMPIVSITIAVLVRRRRLPVPEGQTRKAGIARSCTRARRLDVHYAVARRFPRPDAGADGFILPPLLHALVRPDASQRRRVRRRSQFHPAFHARCHVSISLKITFYYVLLAVPVTQIAGLASRC